MCKLLKKKETRNILAPTKNTIINYLRMLSNSRLKNCAPQTVKIFSDFKNRVRITTRNVQDV